MAIGERAAGTSILFLLEAGQGSHWHQVDADEFWLWHAGAPRVLRIADCEGDSVQRSLLGLDPLAGQDPQVLVPTGNWQATDPANAWTLVSCLVIPGFLFEGFKLAPPEWAAHLDALAAAPKSR